MWRVLLLSQGDLLGHFVVSGIHEQWVMGFSGVLNDYFFFRDLDFLVHFGIRFLNMARVLAPVYCKGRVSVYTEPQNVRLYASKQPIRQKKGGKFRPEQSPIPTGRNA